MFQSILEAKAHPVVVGTVGFVAGESVEMVSALSQNPSELLQVIGQLVIAIVTLIKLIRKPKADENKVS